MTSEPEFESPLVCSSSSAIRAPKRSPGWCVLRRSDFEGVAYKPSEVEPSALALGLGGREAASEQAKEWQRRLRERNQRNPSLRPNLEPKKADQS